MDFENGNGSENIQVCLRLRPRNKREIENGEESIWKVREDSVCINENSFEKIMYLKSGGAKTMFNFNHCFSGQHDNRHIYEAGIKSIVLATLRGINGTVFTYGQTGSGKTFTLLGNENVVSSLSSEDLAQYLQTDRNTGTMLASMADLFEAIRNDKDKNYFVKCSYIEIYNDLVYDLLPREQNFKDTLGIVEDHNKEFLVRNVTEEVVTSVEEVISMLKLGERNRHYAATKMNHHSSRSHTLFRLTIRGMPEQGDDEKNFLTEAMLNFVDLAGSEKLGGHSSNQRVTEGKSINKSLFYLTRVIKLKSEGFSHIPFRDSPLTKILKSSLGGNSRTMVVLVATPVLSQFDQTVSTMRFGACAKLIENKVQANIIRKETNEQLSNKLNEYERRLKEMEELKERHREYVEALEEEKRLLQDRLQQNDDQRKKMWDHTISDSNLKKFLKSVNYLPRVGNLDLAYDPERIKTELPILSSGNISLEGLLGFLYRHPLIVNFTAEETTRLCSQRLQLIETLTGKLGKMQSYVGDLEEQLERCQKEREDLSDQLLEQFEKSSLTQSQLQKLTFRISKYEQEVGPEKAATGVAVDLLEFARGASSKGKTNQKLRRLNRYMQVALRKRRMLLREYERAKPMKVSQEVQTDLDMSTAGEMADPFELSFTDLSSQDNLLQHSKKEHQDYLQTIHSLNYTAESESPMRENSEWPLGDNSPREFNPQKLEFEVSVERSTSGSGDGHFNQQGSNLSDVSTDQSQIVDSFLKPASSSHHRTRSMIDRHSPESGGDVRSAARKGSLNNSMIKPNGLDHKILANEIPYVKYDVKTDNAVTTIVRWSAIELDGVFQPGGHTTNSTSSSSTTSSNPTTIPGFNTLTAPTGRSTERQGSRTDRASCVGTVNRSSVTRSKNEGSLTSRRGDDLGGLASPRNNRVIKKSNGGHARPTPTIKLPQKPLQRRDSASDAAASSAASVCGSEGGSGTAEITPHALTVESLTIVPKSRTMDRIASKSPERRTISPRKTVESETSHSRHGGKENVASNKPQFIAEKLSLSQSISSKSKKKTGANRSPQKGSSIGASSSTSSSSTAPFTFQSKSSKQLGVRSLKSRKTAEIGNSSSSKTIESCVSPRLLNGGPRRTSGGGYSSTQRNPSSSSRGQGGSSLMRANSSGTQNGSEGAGTSKGREVSPFIKTEQSGTGRHGTTSSGVLSPKESKKTPFGYAARAAKKVAKH